MDKAEQIIFHIGHNKQFDHFDTFNHIGTFDKAVCFWGFCCVFCT